MQGYFDCLERFLPCLIAQAGPELEILLPPSAESGITGLPPDSRDHHSLETELTKHEEVPLSPELIASMGHRVLSLHLSPRKLLS